MKKFLLLLPLLALFVSCKNDANSAATNENVAPTENPAANADPIDTVMVRQAEIKARTNVAELNQFVKTVEAIRVPTQKEKADELALIKKLAGDISIKQMNAADNMQALIQQTPQMASQEELKMAGLKSQQMIGRSQGYIEYFEDLKVRLKDVSN